MTAHLICPLKMVLINFAHQKVSLSQLLQSLKEGRADVVSVEENHSEDGEKAVRWVAQNPTGRKVAERWEWDADLEVTGEHSREVEGAKGV